MCTLWYMDLVAPTRNRTHVSYIDWPMVSYMLCHQARPVPNILRVCLPVLFGRLTID